MFIIHIHVINQVSEFCHQQIVRRLVKGEGKGNDEVSLFFILNKRSTNNISYDAYY